MVAKPRGFKIGAADLPGLEIPAWRVIPAQAVEFLRALVH
jgi:hypothetical protein